MYKISIIKEKMFMKNIFRSLSVSLAACLSIIMMTFSVSAAETEDFEAPLNKVKTTNGNWEQSLTLDVNDFDCSRITPDSVVTVEFTLDGEPPQNIAPVELILFNYTEEIDRIWAKIEPFEYDETSASFDYETMTRVYGSEDLTTVDNLCIGDTGVPLTVTKLTITNCTIPEVTTTTTAEETTAAISETTSPETTAAPVTTTAAQPEKAEENSGVPIVLIVVITVVVAVAVVATIVILKNKRRFY